MRTNEGVQVNHDELAVVLSIIDTMSLRHHTLYLVSVNVDNIVITCLLVAPFCLEVLLGRQIMLH